MPALSDLPRYFQDASYERDVLGKIAAITPMGSGVDPTALEELTREPTRANILARLFYMARSLPRPALEAALSAPMCQLLIEEGLLVDAGGGELKALCAIVPARGFWGLRDFDAWATGKPLAQDHVLGAGIASALLADFTVRRTGERVLDLGTGQGFQAAMAARHAASIVATDINQRALRLAALAMRINGIPGVDLRSGSLFEPVEHEKGTFDLLVSNPPFVIAPPHDLTVMGGRWIGDSFVENLITRAPEFLREGGWSTVICNWHHPTPADWSPRPVSWVTGRGVDAWIVKLKTDDPRTYAENWLRESATTEGDAAMAAAHSYLPAWLAYYQTLNVGAISMGVVYLRKRSPRPGEPANWVRIDDLDLNHYSGQASAQVQRLFDGQTLLRGLASEADLLDQRLAVCSTSELIQHLRPADGQWKTQESLIRQTIGFQFPIALNPLLAMIIGQLDGQRPAREVIKDLALEMKADPAVACEKTAPFLARMVRMTHIAVPSPPPRA